MYKSKTTICLGTPNAELEGNEVSDMQIGPLGETMSPFLAEDTPDGLTVGTDVQNKDTGSIGHRSHTTQYS